MDLEESIVDGCCLPNFIGSARIALISESYRTIACTFTLLDLCGKAPVKFLNPFLLFHTTHVSSLFLCLGKILYMTKSPNMILTILLTGSSFYLDPDVLNM